MPIDPVLIRRLAQEAGYLATTLEKVARLEDLLRETARHPQLSEHLALKGGTVINFILLPEALRLSVDIDLNYIGAVGREEMRADRPAVEEVHERIFNAQSYEIQRRATYGSTAWTLRYTNLAGSRDSVKVEVNWLLRVPIWTPERLAFRSIFPGEPVVVTVLSREEVVAGKVAALLDRAAPRDLFDVATLVDHGAIGDLDRLRRATTLLGTFQTSDFRRRIERAYIDDVGDRELRNALWQTLRRDLRPTVDQLKASAEPLLRDVLSLGDRENAYLATFYEARRFDPLPLFDGTGAAADLPRHPMAAWRLQQLERSLSSGEV